MLDSLLTCAGPVVKCDIPSGISKC